MKIAICILSEGGTENSKQIALALETLSQTRQLNKTMHDLLIPMLGSLIWVGGGSVGLVLLIVVIVLILR